MEASKLAALLASHICHELVSPVSSFKLVQDSLGDPDMRDHAEELIKSSSATLEYKLTFLRYAFGSIGLQAGYADLNEAKELCTNYMRGFRADLDWQVGTEVTTYNQVRLLMNMLLITVSGMPRGGMITLSSVPMGDKVMLRASGQGPRARVNDQMLSALNGKEPEGGWMAKVIQPYFTKVIAEELNANVEIELAEDKIELKTTVLSLTM